MPVTVKFKCSGCFIETEGTHFLKRQFRSFNETPWGVGTYHYDSPQDVAPEGWIAFDPYTGCCYCPKCWAEIEAYTPDQEPPSHD